MARAVFIGLVLVIIVVRDAAPSSEVMKYITAGFLKTLDDCKHELNLSDNIVSDLYHFWKQEYELLNRETGCIILCMSRKLNLIDTSGRLHHGSAQDFAMQHGAAEDVAVKLVNMLHECEKQSLAVEDECARTLEVAKCFRNDIRGLDWSPKADVLITEILTDL
ncbi:general odorant-binding protein 1-like [Achroia grisella]|uniref:general odorant-binding protein 1-like n=1 Tax=Achroia grisella TaxID=688607 RepID=UPI0027D33729|nr:general odorant-binding protein 1-like [Achroia grisella]